MTEATTAETSPTAAPSGAPVGAADAPYVPPPSSGPRISIAPLSLAHPFRWLAMGWRDFVATPGIGLFYGLCFCLMALALQQVFRHRPEYLMTIVSGSLLVGPFLAMGLSDVSRRREALAQPSLTHSLTCWKKNFRTMGMLLMVVLVLEMLWGRASLVVIAVSTDGMPSTDGVLASMVAAGNWEFLMAYFAVGGIFATLVYAIAVVSIPMILDRDTDAISAALASVRLVYEHPLVMLFWAALIVGLTVAAIAPMALGLLVVGPWLGHASWHA